MANEILTQGRLTWRDWTTDGVPSTGEHEVSKADARQFAQVIQNDINQIFASILSNALHFDTRANLYLVTTAAVNVGAFVWSDATEAFRGIYRSDGAGAWTRISDLPSGVQGPAGGTGPTGLTGATYRGSWVAGTYVSRDLVWHAPTLTVWYCNVTTTVGVPGVSPDWIIFVDNQASAGARDAAIEAAEAAASSEAATAADRVQTGLDRTAAANSAASAGTSANNAIGAVAGLTWVKAPVRAVITKPITLSGEQTHDGVSLIAGDRVLYVGAYSASAASGAPANGLYVVAAGAWSRAADADTAGELAGMIVMVLEGTRYRGTVWKLTTTAAITVGTTPLTFQCDEQRGLSFADAVRVPKCRLSFVGDSNSDEAGYPTLTTYRAQELTGLGCPLEGGIMHTMAANGSSFASWLGQIGSGSQAATVTKGNPWSVVNNDPHLIWLQLGTNDCGLLSLRATAGQLATLRTNAWKLITFLLHITRGAILMVMPQPFTPVPFSGQNFADADEAALYSGYMRTVYREFMGVSPRIAVYDTHDDLTGDRIDDQTVAPLDPETGGQIMQDAFHLSDLGRFRLYRRVARMMNNSIRRDTRFLRTTQAIHMAQGFAIPVFIGATAVSGTLLTTYSNPQKILGRNAGADRTGIAQAGAGASLSPILDTAFVFADPLARLKLFSLHNATALKLYFPVTGVTYNLTQWRFSSTGTVSFSEQTDTWTTTGDAVLETGVALLYVEGWDHNHNIMLPTERITVNVERTNDIIVPFQNVRGMRTELVAVRAARGPTIALAGGCDVHLFNSSTVNTGTKCFDVDFAAGATLTSGVVDAANYPSGVKFDSRATTSNWGLRLTGMSNFGTSGYMGTVTFHVRYYPV